MIIHGSIAQVSVPAVAAEGEDVEMIRSPPIAAGDSLADQRQE
jgi:hypothetical protein